VLLPSLGELAGAERLTGSLILLRSRQRDGIAAQQVSFESAIKRQCLTLDEIARQE